MGSEEKLGEERELREGKGQKPAQTFPDQLCFPTFEPRLYHCSKPAVNTFIAFADVAVRAAAADVAIPARTYHAYAHVIRRVRFIGDPVPVRGRIAVQPVAVVRDRRRRLVQPYPVIDTRSPVTHIGIQPNRK